MRRGYQHGVGELYSDIFKTSCNYCAVIYTDSGKLVRIYFPKLKARAVSLVKGLPKKPYKQFRQKVVDYFKGRVVSFSEFEVAYDNITPFRKLIYQVLKRIKRGKTLTYGELAIKAGKRGAARAVGTAMKNNHLPLVVPCHRVIKSDGSLGQFSLDGGVDLKRKMLELEGSSF